MTDTILTADIGGSHITSSLVDGRSHHVMEASLKRKQVNAMGTANQIVFDWCSILHDVATFAESPIEKVAISMPGPFDYESGVCYLKGNNKYEALYGLNIKTIISEWLSIPVNAIRITNDAACFLQGEVVAGSASATNRSIGLTLGTGIGSAFYQDGVATDAKLWESSFKDGIAEDYLATAWFVKRFLALTGKVVADVKELCQRQDAFAEVQTIFDEFAQNLSEFLIPFIKRENPDVVILGGNMMKASHFFMDNLHANLESRCNVPLLPARLGEQAAMIGAAHAWTTLS